MKNYFAISAFLSLVIATTFLALSGGNEPVETGNEGIQKFQSEQAFRDFVSSSNPTSTDTLGRTTDFNADLSPESDSGSSGSSTAVDRMSDTNIQVKGVQEPDILKNAGEKIFYSPENTDYRFYSSGRRKNASVFNTLPAENFSEINELPEDGKMFLKNSSVIFLGDSITSYSRETYQQKWNIELNSSIETARKINNSIYLVLREKVDKSNPCPVRPLSSVEIPCTDFYRPSDSQRGDTAYTLTKIDAETGKVQETEGFVGSGQNTIVYVSKNSVYLTYLEQRSETEVRMEFLDDKGSELLDQKTVDRIDEVKSYNISDEALQVEIRNLIRDYRKSLSEKEASEFEKEFQNSWGNYTDERKRTLSTTGIAKFNSDLKLETQGQVPGETNDQFSLSEKEGDFRIATTVGNSWQFDAESENDLYILDENLERKGEIQGLGLTEEIYSVRYVNDKAYIVTFRRIDPFHTIDLSDPSNPELLGELKLPGYSSYLHPLSQDRILGIGEEDGSVKAVIFDVSEDEPEIEESIVLNDWYSEISSSHHAFKIDRKHKVFFLPGSNGGNIFNYSQGLKQVKKVNMTDVKRATYVNDNLYVFSETEAAVIDQTNMETIKNLHFREKRDIVEGPVIDRPQTLR